MRAGLPSGVPAAPLAHRAHITRQRRATWLQAPWRARGVCLEARCLPSPSSHRLPRPDARRVSHRAAADARVVAGGVRRRWHRLLQREPTACNGTYSVDQYGYPSLCAPLPRLPCDTNERRAAEGVATWLPGLGGRRWEEWRAALRRGRARRASAALRGSAMDAPPLLLPLWCPSRRSLDNNDLDGGERALAARTPHRADGPVSRRSSAPPPPSRGKVGAERARRVAAHRGKARASHLPPSALVAVPPMIPLRRPSRRFLYDNSLGGSLPSQLGLLTALDSL